MVRIQIDLPDEQVATLDELMTETKLRTRKELFNNALTLFDWAVKQKKSGYVIAAIDQDRDVVKELLMPALESASLHPVLPHEEEVGEVIGAATPSASRRGA